MSNKVPFNTYFSELHAIARQVDAREESFYPALSAMFKTVADAAGLNHVRVTTLPKSTDAGHPDFRLWNGTDRIVGYVEAKRPTEERLDVIEESEQLARYRATFPNLILSNFFEFRLYRNGERVQTVLSARPFVLTRLGAAPVVERADELLALLNRFLDFSLPRAFTAESLAMELAKRTRFLREVVGMITNHSYLDNPTFRGMRRSLMQTFDDIYILDLHGNALKREVCPDGSPDKSVFDIRQGVAICLLVKTGATEPATSTSDTSAADVSRVLHAELHGSREAKYNWLDAHAAATTRWQKLAPRSGSYLFVRRDETSMRRYERYPSIPDIFPVNSVGIVTARDGLVFDTDRVALKRRIKQFQDESLSDAMLKKAFSLRESQAWSLRSAREALRDLPDIDRQIAPCLYRPFDTRWLFYHESLIDRGRMEVMRHMQAGDNLALLLPKRVEHAGSWQHVFVTDAISDHVAVSLKTIDYHFPLYLHPKSADAVKFRQKTVYFRTTMLFDADELYGIKTPNLNSVLVTALAKSYGGPPTPEEIFHYIYAVLYATAYRMKDAEFLKTDFPRIPFAADVRLFRKLAALGGKLAGLHLLTSSDLDPPACRFEGDGDNRVGKDRKRGLRYDAVSARVYINGEQHFAPVPEAVWAYQVGGYQVCGKWLKDRKECRLELDDIRTYCRIVTSLGRTIKLQSEIDALYSIAESATIPTMPKAE